MHTNYRFADKNGEILTGDYELRDELNSVFFTITEEYFQDFGNLNKISAQWYEYKTNLMYVTSNAAAYSSLFNMRNIEIDCWGRIPESDQALSNYRVMWRKQANLAGGLVNASYQFYASYNPYCYKNPSYSATGLPMPGITDEFSGIPDVETRLDWLFYIDSDIAGYDIYGEDGWFSQADYRVTSDKVKEYMNTYSSNFYTQDKILGKYASGLFADSIDVDRLQFLDANAQRDSNGNFLTDENGNIVWKQNATSGLVKMNYYVDDKYNVGNSFFNPDNWWNRFWYGPQYEELTYSPMVVISEGDIYLSDEDFSEKYYVNLSDAKKIKSEAEKAYKNNERPVLLRFAVTDYYASTALFEKAEETNLGNFSFNGYVAQETVFLDFDVLSFGFQDENGYTETVIPVVAEPIDIINGLTPPDDLVEDQEWYQKLVALILFVIVLFAIYVALDIWVPWLAKIIRWVVGAFWWLFASLVKLITWPFRALLSNVTYKVKRKIEVKASRRRSKRRRGRPSKKSKKKPRSKKETRNQRLMKETFSNARAKARETVAKAKAKASSLWSDIKIKIRGK